MAKLRWLTVSAGALALAFGAVQAQTATSAAAAAVAPVASAASQAVSPAAQKMVGAAIARLRRSARRN